MNHKNSFVNLIFLLSSSYFNKIVDSNVIVIRINILLLIKGVYTWTFILSNVFPPGPCDLSQIPDAGVMLLLNPLK